MLETAEIEHANTTVGSTTDKDINATCAEAYIEDLLVVGNQVCSGVFELERSASGVSLGSCGSRVFTEDERVIVLLMLLPEALGNDHNRR